MTEDEEHLRWLSIAHYVVAALYALFNLLMLGFMIFPIWMATRPGGLPRGRSGGPPPEFFVGMMSAIVVLMLVMSGTMIVCIFLAARYLASRKHYVFCFVVGALDCMWFPFGTVLGVFTIIVLSRPSVKILFGRIPPPDPAGGGLPASA